MVRQKNRRRRRDGRCLVGLLLLIVLCGAGCAADTNKADAYGTFEATEILISAERGGRLLSFEVDEGDQLSAGQLVGVVDTVQLVLQRAQLLANHRAIRSKDPSVRAQIDVLDAQRQVALTEKERLDRLFKDQAATQQQLDAVNGQLDVLDQQIRSVGTQNATIRAELDALDAQVAQLDDQVRRSRIVNPVAGTVLAVYAASHELTAPGKPLYKIANLDTIFLRAYISGAQLPHLRLGQPVEVQIDDTRTANQALPGEIVWIASEAEFTPKIIQTKAERVNLVYAVKVRVANPGGVLKIGMPGEVWIAGTDTRAVRGSGP